MKELILDINTESNKSNDINDVEKEVDNIMTQIDIKNTGTIEFDEFKIAWQRKMLSKQTDYINKVFECMCIHYILYKPE